MALDTLLLLTIAVLSVILLIGSFRAKRATNKPDQTLLLLLNDLRKEIQDTTNSQRKEVDGKLNIIHEKLVSNLENSSNTLQKHFRHTSGVMQDVTERLTKLDETNKQVLGFSKQLQSLENILKNPKQRGILGEYWLEALLAQVLAPGLYKMQHELGVDELSGQKLIPDAVIFVKDITIPIDAKFSLENYNRVSQETNSEKRALLEKAFKADVKLRIDETSKYIQPEMGTPNFAFMFVPAEGVYHNLISHNVGNVKVNTRNLIEYAFEKGVMIVSPTSFFAYLQTVIMGLKALQIEESVKDIQTQAGKLMRHMKAYEEHHNRLGKHLETTVRAYGASSKELNKVDKDIYKITDGAAGKELDLLDVTEARDE